MAKNDIQFDEELIIIAQNICDIGLRLYQKNLLAAADGNISVRIAEDQFLITPTGVSKAFMDFEAMCVIDIDGNAIVGEPSSEKLMHLEIYRKCPEAMAVVHAHPPTAIGFTVAFPDQVRLPDRCLSEVILACGSVPIVPYAEPGGVDMADKISPFLPESRALLLARHGALTWGESLEEAWRGMERIEHSAQILLAAKSWGGHGLTELPADQVLRLYELRKSIGNKLL